MSEDEYGKPSGSLADELHRKRPGLARWTRVLAAIACILGGAILVARGAIESDPLWLWVGVPLAGLGIMGLLLALWMHRRRL